MFYLVTDSSANLDEALLREKRIVEIPFLFNAEGRDRAVTNLAAFNGKAFYDAMREGLRVTTSQIAPQRFADCFRPLLAAGQDVVFVSMSGGISGSYNSAVMAAEQLREEFPERTVYPVDTLGASLGEGLLVLRAAECRDGGMSAAETAAFLEDLRQAVCQVFTVDNLKYLRATGRLSRIKTAVADLLQIKPLLKGDEGGRIVCFSKVRGRKRSVAALAEQYDAMVRDPETQTVGIAHADCPEDAETLAALLREHKPPREILTVCYEPVTGSHVGPGALALFFLGDREFRGRD